jgi:hypothetical protein
MGIEYVFAIYASAKVSFCAADIGQIEGRSGSARQAPIGQAVKPTGDHLDDQQCIVAGRIQLDRLL